MNGTIRKRKGKMKEKSNAKLKSVEKKRWKHLSEETTELNTNALARLLIESFSI